MYGIYGDIIDAAERALEGYGEAKELLEYPEVQADKAHYLSVLSRYNELNAVKVKLDALKGALGDANAFSALAVQVSSDAERDEIYAEISALKRRASALSRELSLLIGCRNATERAVGRFKFRAASAPFGTALYGLLKAFLTSRGCRVLDEKVTLAKEGYAREISFIAQGENALELLYPLTGAHRVYTPKAGSEELAFAVTTAPAAEKLDEKDLKIDVFHSSGAGGQNVNKVETAVRITHLPTGISVVCQDERSQLKNKNRALKTIEERLKELNEKNEKKRIEADISACYRKKNTSLSFDAGRRTMTDTRLKAFTQVAFPPTDAEFTEYMNGLIAL